MTEDRGQVCFPFFVGRGRSGTTMLRAIFDTHPKLCVPDESHFVSALGRRRRRYERGGGFDVERFVAELLARPSVRRWAIPPGVLYADLKASPPANYPDAVRRVFRLKAHAAGKERYADKTPNYVMSIGFLAGLFPEARFVHVIRDGRDVSMSYLEVPWGPTSLEESALLWRRAVRNGRRSGSGLGAGRYREVRYETLVSHPEATVRELCEFLDLDYDPVMLSYHETSERIVSSMRHPETRKALHQPPTRNLRNWRTEMSAHDAAMFDVWVGDQLDELGYGRAGPRPGPALRREARLRWLRMHARRSGLRAATLLKRR